MISKSLIKNIILDNQQREIPDLWERSQIIPVDSKKIVTLTGVRRSGKTYCLYALIQKLKNSGIQRERIVYLNFEDERLDFNSQELDLIIQAYQELFPKQKLKDCFFFFDEIQEAPGWEKFITRIHDMICSNIFITGSNARLLSQEIATSLRGRSLTYEIFPFSFSEYINIQTQHTNPYNSSDRAVIVHQFDQFLAYGGFPELIKLNPSLKEKSLQEYFNVMLFRDIVDHYHVSNISTLKYFCKRLIGSSAGEFSVHKIFNELKSQGYRLSKDSIYAFQEYVESVYMCRFVKKWSPSVIKSEGALRKCYVIDHGLGSALDYKFSQDKGRRLETLVALELIKSGKSIYYQQNGCECDFVVTEKGVVSEAIQVSLDISDPQTRDREIKGLLQCCKYHKLDSGYILTLDYEERIEIDETTIQIIPVWRYLLRHEQNDL